MSTKQRPVEPFYYPGNSVGCLLIHGFTGSPGEMSYLGERLAASGWTVSGVRLAGHGTEPEDLAKTEWQDWVRDAQAGVDQLRTVCDTVIGVGLSMGGLISLHLAAQGQLDGLVSLNAPMLLADRRTRLAGMMKPFVHYVGKPASKRNGNTGVIIQEEHFNYDRVPVAGLASLNKAIRQVRRELPQINCPTLLMQSVKDRTVLPRSVEIIEQGIRQGKRITPEVRYWQNSGHILTLGQEREEVAMAVGEFVNRSSRSEV